MRQFEHSKNDMVTSHLNFFLSLWLVLLECHTWVILMCSISENYNLFLKFHLWQALKQNQWNFFHGSNSSDINPISCSYHVHCMWKHAVSILYLQIIVFVIKKFIVHNPYIQINYTDVSSLQENLWCIGWQNSGAQSRDSKNMTLLGGILLKSLSMP